MKQGDDFYKRFLKSMTKKLDRDNFDTAAELDRLIEMERNFIKILKSSKSGQKIFYNFITYIKDDIKSILVAKVFFREREKTYSEFISDIIKENKGDEISNFSLNYKFINWVISSQPYPAKKRLEKIYNQICRARKEILNQNLPLVVNQARLYQWKSRKKHIEPIEFIQCASEGFMSAIDKCVPAPEVRFQGVAVGWMSSKLMAEFSDTFIKLTVQERKILYRIRMGIFKEGIRDIEKLTTFVKEKYPKATKDKIESLLAATDVPGEIMVEIESSSSEVVGFESYYDIDKLNRALMSVSNMERKILLLRGGFSNEVLHSKQ